MDKAFDFKLKQKKTTGISDMNLEPGGVQEHNKHNEGPNSKTYTHNNSTSQKFRRNASLHTYEFRMKTR